VVEGDVAEDGGRCFESVRVDDGDQHWRIANKGRVTTTTLTTKKGPSRSQLAQAHGLCDEADAEQKGGGGYETVTRNEAKWASRSGRCPLRE
jgi:hypothetical protein